MYNEHFGLRQAPFRITPDTRLFFSGGGRGDILDALVYAITSGEGIIKVVGEVGSGKTMLCRMLEERLPENVEIVYLANPSLSPDDILQAIALEMNLEVPDNAKRLQVMHALQQRLVEKHAKNRQVVMFIEEAQGMPIETLEEIRLLSNLETEREKLLQIVLFGQPELDENLDQANIRQLRERITHSFHLEPLSRNELRDYVNYRMRAAGYRGPDVFRPNAFHILARASEGLTRRINILADKALLAAFAENRHDVKRKDVQKAIADSRFERRRPSLAPRITMALGITMVAGAAAWTVFERSQWPVQHPSAPAGAEAVTPARKPAGAETVPAARASPEAAEKTTIPAAAAADLPAPLPDTTPAGMPPAAAETNTALRMTSRADESGPAEAPQPETVAAAVEPAENIRIAEAAVAPPATGSMAAAEPIAAETPEPVKPAAEAAAGRSAAAEPSGVPAPASAPEEAPAADRADTAAQTQHPAEGVTSARPAALLDQRMEITRDWLRNTNEAHYSIQLLLTARSQRRHLEAFLERQARGEGLQHLYVYETIIDDRPYLGVLYGEFSTLTAAREALDNLPPALKRLGPFIRNVSDISTTG